MRVCEREWEVGQQPRWVGGQSERFGNGLSHWRWRWGFRRTWRVGGWTMTAPTGPMPFLAMCTLIHNWPCSYLMCWRLWSSHPMVLFKSYGLVLDVTTHVDARTGLLSLIVMTHSTSASDLSPSHAQPQSDPLRFQCGCATHHAASHDVVPPPQWHSPTSCQEWVFGSLKLKLIEFEVVLNVD